MDEDSPSDDDREELQALVPTVDKGKVSLSTDSATVR